MEEEVMEEEVMEEEVMEEEVMEEEVMEEKLSSENIEDQEIRIGSFSIPIKLKDNPKDAFYQGVIWTFFSLVSIVTIAIIVGFVVKLIT